MSKNTVLIFFTILLLFSQNLLSATMDTYINYMNVKYNLNQKNQYSPAKTKFNKLMQLWMPAKSTLA